MLFRTHIAIAVFLGLLIINSLNHQFLFLIMLFIGAVVPDLDTKYSFFGKNIIFRPFQFFVNHRGMVHSLIFGIIISVILAIFLPILSLGFFLGFSSHLIADSFTREGIMPFYPSKKRAMGPIRTGSKTEDGIFIVLIFFIFFLILRLFN